MPPYPVPSCMHEHEPRMQVADVNGVPTHVFSLKTKVRSSSLLLVVPGSPGMGHFYIPFATRLFHLGSGAYDVAIVSHAGHSPGFSRPSNSDQDSSEPGRDWYSLEDQIAHKLAYITEHAREKESLYLVGHSIGCFMILRLLRQLAPTLVRKAVFLFPTIERMLQTPNGEWLSPYFRPALRSPIASMVGLLSWLPHSLKGFLLRRYFHTTPSDHVEHVTQGTINIDGSSMYNVLCMAHQEMHEVSALPIDIIHEHIDKLVFYYGVEDKWNVGSCYRDMAERFPDKDITLCQSGHPHAFVLTASHEMADFVFSRLPKDRANGD